MSSKKLLTNGTYGWAVMGPNRLAGIARATSNKIGMLIKRHNIDALAFCGSSGSALAFYLGIEHKIPMMYIRKQGEQSHSNGHMECNTDREILKYLVVDDFICSGDTVLYVMDKVRDHYRYHNHFGRVSHPEPKCEGVFLYDYQGHSESGQSQINNVPIYF
jgi:hypothetical protein